MALREYYCINCSKEFKQRRTKKYDYTARCPKCHKGIYVVLKEHPLVSRKKNTGSKMKKQFLCDYCLLEKQYSELEINETAVGTICKECWNYGKGRIF